jgi:hypothetical protein
VNLTRIYLQAVFTQKAEKRFRIELEKLKAKTSVRKLRKAISKAKGYGKSLTHGHHQVLGSERVKAATPQIYKGIQRQTTGATVGSPLLKVEAEGQLFSNKQKATQL